MSEKLFSRVKRLISGALYNSVEVVEAAMPEVTMREAIREIDQTIDDVREELRKVTGERHIAGKRIKLSQDKINGLQEKIETAMKADREDLAQAAIERELDLEAQIPVLEEAQSVANKQIAELNSYISALQGRKSEMEAELDAFSQTVREAEGNQVVVEGLNGTERHEKRAEKAEQAFDRVLKNSTGVDSIGKSDRETIAKLVELEAIERQNKISNRLEAYRKELAEETAPTN